MATGRRQIGLFEYIQLGNPFTGYLGAGYHIWVQGIEMLQMLNFWWTCGTALSGIYLLLLTIQ